MEPAASWPEVSVLEVADGCVCAGDGQAGAWGRLAGLRKGFISTGLTLKG